MYIYIYMLFFLLLIVVNIWDVPPVGSKGI